MRRAFLRRAEDADTADALRAAMPTANPDAQVLAVVAGDLVTDVRLSDVLATHVRGGAVATCLLAKRRAWNGLDMKVGRPPKGAHYVGLANDRLLLMADEADVDKVLKLGGRSWAARGTSSCTPTGSTRSCTCWTRRA